MSNDKFTVVGTNISEKATMIWNVADLLRGPFKPHEYGLVILPMTVVKRFHDCLLPTHQAVLSTYENVKKLAVNDGFLRCASGYQFYNISKFTFDRLIADPENIESNFRDYLNGFSANVQDVLSKFDFDNIIKRLVESNTLYLVIKEFASQKRNDIGDSDRALIVRAYSAFENGAVYGDKCGVYCESKVYDTDAFGYNKIVVERPERDADGAVVKKKGKPVANADLRDTENVPLTEDIDEYFAREVLPYAPDAWIDKSKTKIGYEIPMTRYFYEYQQPEASGDILARIIGLEDSISASLKHLFGEG